MSIEFPRINTSYGVFMPIFNNMQFDMPLLGIQLAVFEEFNFKDNFAFTPTFEVPFCSTNYSLTATSPFTSNACDNSVVTQGNSVNTGNQSYDVTTVSNATAAELQTKWSKKRAGLPIEFYGKVIQVSNKVKCNPNDLLALMMEESGIKASKYNMAGSGAVGLIQFMPKTAKGLGTSTTQLANMTETEQLSYVEKFLLNARNIAGFNNDHYLSRGELGALTFLPAYAKRAVLTSRGHQFYDSNKSLDYNKDGQITTDDLSLRLGQFLA